MNLDRPSTELLANLICVWILSNYFPVGDLDQPAQRQRGGYS
jgi:hypothetical protein